MKFNLARFKSHRLLIATRYHGKEWNQCLKEATEQHQHLLVQ